MLDKAMFAVYMAYWNARTKLMKLADEEDGMETIETVILIAIAVVIGVALLEILTKNFGGNDQGVIGYVFEKIKGKIDELFT